MKKPNTDADQYRQLLERIPAVTYRAELGSSCRWHFISPQIESLLGYSSGEWQAEPDLWFKCVHPDDRARVLEADDLTRREGLPFSCEYRLIARDGREIWVRDEGVTAYDDAAGADVMEGVLLDISNQKRAEEELVYLAEHDVLTGLCNRRRFASELEAHVGVGRRYGAAGAVLLLDLDNLKRTNDLLGHDCGDELLKAAADVLRSRLRDSDVVARFGGDEFAVLLPRAGRENAELVGRALIEGIRRSPLILKGQAVRTTASVGIALVADVPDATADAVLAEADAALYAAKAQGRNRCVLRQAS